MGFAFRSSGLSGTGGGGGFLVGGGGGGLLVGMGGVDNGEASSSGSIKASGETDSVWIDESEAISSSDAHAKGVSGYIRFTA